MAVTDDIVRTWRGPRAVMRDLLAHGRREDRAFAYLMAACFLIFIAQWPRLSRRAQGFELPEGAEQPVLEQLVAYEMLSWLIVWPLLFYGLAALSHLAARAIGGQGTWYTARLALFWSLLASVPVLLLHGLTAAFMGPGTELSIVGGIWVLAFGTIWIQSLREAEGPAGQGV